MTVSATANDYEIMDRTIRPGSKVCRYLQLDRAGIDLDARTVSLAFSSETPYERYWGVEILDHGEGSIRLDRLKSGAPLLLDHDNSVRSQVGVVEAVEIGPDRVGRAVVRIGRDTDSDTVWQKITDGIVRNVSVGYIIHKAVMEKKSGDGPDIYRVTDWEPLEISLVSVPADQSVGIGRSMSDDGGPDIITSTARGASIMTDTIDIPAIERAAAESAARAANQRVAEIIALGEMHAARGGVKLASEALRNGLSVDEFRAQLLDHLAKQPQPTADIGLTSKEAQQYSFLRAINALANPTDRKAQEAAALEREASEAVAQRIGRQSRGLFVPNEIMQRDLVVGTGTAGGHTVATNLLAANFIELLRNRLAVMAAGAQMLTGLVGNIAIPRQTGGATAYWVAESGSPTESQAAFDQVTMSPKTVGAYTDISRKLLLQSSLDVEAFVRNDLATVLALAIDLAAINGSGTGNEPRGVLNTTGIGDVAGGANGAAPTWAHIVSLETLVSVANADVGTLAYLTNAKVRGKLKTTEKATSTAQFVWESNDAPLNGYRAVVSNQVPSNLTKGTSNGICSAILFGNWSDLIIGQWGTLDLMVDPYTGSTSGTVRVVALQDVDIAVRTAASFAAMKDALTT